MTPVVASKMLMKATNEHTRMVHSTYLTTFAVSGIIGALRQVGPGEVAPLSATNGATTTVAKKV